MSQEAEILDALLHGAPYQAEERIERLLLGDRRALLAAAEELARLCSDERAEMRRRERAFAETRKVGALKGDADGLD
jgi:hypothetical protein